MYTYMTIVITCMHIHIFLFVCVIDYDWCIVICVWGIGVHVSLYMNERHIMDTCVCVCVCETEWDFVELYIWRKGPTGADGGSRRSGDKYWIERRAQLEMVGVRRWHCQVIWRDWKTMCTCLKNLVRVFYWLWANIWHEKNIHPFISLTSKTIVISEYNNVWILE